MRFLEFQKRMKMRKMNQRKVVDACEVSVVVPLEFIAVRVEFTMFTDDR